MHKQHAAAARHGDATVPPIAPTLMRRIADARIMREACDQLVRNGPTAPGPNGWRFDDLESAEIWPLCRALGKSVLAGTYRPGPERRVKIAKEGKPGQFREIVVQNIEDRIVGKALQLVLEPIVDPTFAHHSYGFRPGLGPLNALASALFLARSQRRWYWVSADIEKAFDRVPHNRLLDACRHHFPDDVVKFISTVSRTSKRRGQRQGSPASPMLFNIFADRYVDRAWHHLHPEVPVFRYADDLLLLCQSEARALEASAALFQLAQSAGTALKGSASDSIHDLRAGDPIEWLGFLLMRENNRLAVRIAPKAWDHLGHHLEKAHSDDLAALRANQIVAGWLAEMGPCFPFENQDTVLTRLRDMADVLAFDELPADYELISGWSAAHARWQRLYDQEAPKLAHRLTMIKAQ